MIVALACVPQTMWWYDVLPLMLIPATFRESLVFSLVSSSGFLIEANFLGGTDVVSLYEQVTFLMIGFAYIPATILVLRRPNVGDPLPFRGLLSPATRLLTRLRR